MRGCEQFMQASGKEFTRIQCMNEHPLWIEALALAILGLIFTQLSGWFDAQRKELSAEKTLISAQKTQLEVETAQLKERQTDLTNHNAQLEAQIVQLREEQQKRILNADDEIKKFRAREADLTNQIARRELDVKELTLAKESLENTNKSLTGVNAQASQVLEQLKSCQATREQLSTNFVTVQNSNVILLAAIELGEKEKHVLETSWAEEKNGLLKQIKNLETGQEEITKTLTSRNSTIETWKKKKIVVVPHYYQFKSNPQQRAINLASYERVPGNNNDGRFWYRIIVDASSNFYKQIPDMRDVDFWSHIEALEIRLCDPDDLDPKKW
jgi:hypothetical protein